MEKGENNNSKILLAALAGAAIGIAIGYFLNSDKKDEILNDIKGGASKLKDDLSEGFDNLKSTVEEHFKNPTT